MLRVIDGRDGREKMSIGVSTVSMVNGVQRDAAPFGDTSALLIDIDGDRLTEIVYIHHSLSYLVALNSNGTVRWQAQLPHTVGDCIGGPASAGLNSNGKAEILIENLLVSEGANGSPIVQQIGPYISSSCSSFAMSVTGNNSLQLVTAAGVFTKDGTSILSLPNLQANSRGRRLAAADLVSSRSGLELIYSDFGKIYVYNIASGALVWSKDLPSRPSNFSRPDKPSSGEGGPPNVGDFNGDGRPDVAVAGSVYFSVFNGEDGNIIWNQATDDYSSQITGASLFDFNGDGQAEVLYADEGYLRVYRGLTGEELFKIRNPSGTHLEYPVVADVDADGHSEIVIVSNDYADHAAAWADPAEAAAIRAEGSGVRVFKAQDEAGWMPTRKLWNQYAYFVNNVDDNLRPLGATSLLQNHFRRNVLNSFEAICK